MKKTLKRIFLDWCYSAGKPGKTRDPFVRPLVILIGLTAALAFLMDGSPTVAFGGKAPPPEYRLDLMDRIRLRVFEWRPALDEVFEWKALNDEYSVGPTGHISVPLLGQVSVSGKTLQEVSEEIGGMIRTRIGIAAVPKISVEIVRYRPFYITGQVQKPGEYDFRPQLTVLQAVSLAGGLNRAPREQDAGKDLISYRGELNLLNRKYVALLARRARYVSALNGAQEIKFPKELVQRQYQIGQMLDHEAALFRADQATFKANLANLESRKDYLSEAIESLQQQLKTQSAERALAQEELSKVKKLVARKLTVEPRRLAAQKNVYQLEGLKLRLQTELLNARQNLEDVASEIVKARNDHSNTTIAGLRDTQAQIDEVVERMNTLDHLYSNAASLAPTAALALSSEGIKAKYEIVRSLGGYSKVIEVDEGAAVEPGDTVKVKIVSPDSSDLKPMASMFPRDIPLPDLRASPAMADGGRNYYREQPARVAPARDDGPSRKPGKPLRRVKSALESIVEMDQSPPELPEGPLSARPDPLTPSSPLPKKAPGEPAHPRQEAAQGRSLDKGAMLDSSSIPLPVRRPPSPIEEAMIFPERSPIRMAARIQ